MSSLLESFARSRLARIDFAFASNLALEPPFALARRVAFLEACFFAFLPGLTAFARAAGAGVWSESARAGAAAILGEAGSGADGAGDNAAASEAAGMAGAVARVRLTITSRQPAAIIANRPPRA